MAEAIHIDVSDLKRLSVALKKAEPALQKQFLKDLSAAGQIVAARARANASFSSRIPRSIRVRRRGVSVSIEAGGTKAPDAAPFEHGGQSGTFRHPVFGQDVWVNQQAHPFLHPAAEQSQGEIVAAVTLGVDNAFHGLGL